MNESERWVPCFGFPEYEVSSMGNVRRISPAKGAVPGRVLKPRTNARGYLYVNICRYGKAKSMRVHRLVALSFLGPITNGMDRVNHKNGIQSDNRAENLEWTTQRGNIKHAYLTGLSRRGELHGSSVISDAAVEEIRSRYSSGSVSQSALASEYGISRGHVSGIVLMKTRAAPAVRVNG